MKRFLIFIFGIMLWAGLLSNVWAQENLKASQSPQKTFTLRDGSSIQGQLLSVEGGSYIVSNPTMGQVKVPSAQVVSITNSQDSATGAPGSQQPSQTNISSDALHDTQMKMMQDPEIMALLQEMLRDPEIMEILKNPSLLQAAMSGNQEKIRNNPDIQKLLQNPKMQQIMALSAKKFKNSSSAASQ